MATPPSAASQSGHRGHAGHSPSAARVALVGVHGFGAHHLGNLERLQAAGVVELVAVADPQPPEPGSVPAAAAVFPGLTELLADTTDLDVIIVATPIQTHAPLGVAVHWEETYDGVTTSQLSWQLGFGPRTTGWLMRPAARASPS